MSERQKIKLAQTILEHPELDNLREDVQRRLFKKFRTATPPEREIINAILDNEQLFYAELKAIVAANQEIGDTNEQ